MRAHVVVDLGFGDAGKGLLVDRLVRDTGAGLVVRFNGGAQAGHNVVTPDGRHHTFSQLGAGAFAGARTWLSRHVVVHPTALLVEARVLEGKGVPTPLAALRVSAGARLITPYHQAANRLREQLRGAAAHGSCGVGIGETVAHALAHPDEALHAGDLANPAVAAVKLARVRGRLYEALEAPTRGLAEDPRVAAERRVFEDAEVSARWLGAAVTLSPVVAEDEALGRALAGAADVVFEGAQGVLLDEAHGFHPHTTWSRCTFANALELLAAHAPGAELLRFGVLRSHAVRHGAGPLPTEAEGLAERIRTEHNRTNDWQGRVRYGWLDLVLARYALEVVGGVDRLLLTHLDLLGALPAPRLAPRYEGLDSLPVTSAPELDAQARLTATLAAARPVYEGVADDERTFLARVEAGLGAPVALVSRGPRAQDVAPRPAAAT